MVLLVFQGVWRKNTNTDTHSTHKKEIHVSCLLNLLIDDKMFSCSLVRENHITPVSCVGSEQCIGFLSGTHQI